MNHPKVWLLLLVSLYALVFVPGATCQETNTVHFRTTINIGDIKLKEGKLNLYGLLLDVDANERFGVYLFAPSLYANNYWDESSHTGDGWYSVWRQYFSKGIDLKFNLKEWVFFNEVLECGIVIGLNITAHEDTKNIDTELNLPLKDEWDINGTIVKISKEEAALYTVHGMSAINSSIRNRNIQEFYLLRIQVNRKPNIEKTLNWLPPIAMFCLVLASVLVIWKSTLANSLRICLAVAFPSIAYLSFLREITPPTMTSIEWLTLFDIGLCLTFAILAVVADFIRSIRKEKLEEVPKEKKKDNKNERKETGTHACMQIKESVRRNKWFWLIVLVVVGLLIVFISEVLGLRLLDSFAQTMRGFENMFPEAFKGIVTVFGGIITFLLAHYLYEEYRKPKLKIVRVDPLSIVNEKYWRVIVKNTGRTAAENCTGGIHLFGNDANGDAVDVGGGICWSIIENPSAITINVEDEQSLDIYRVSLAQPKYYFFQIPTEKGWSVLRSDGTIPLSAFADPANLKIEIRITAKNARLIARTYTLRKQQNDIVMIA